MELKEQIRSLCLAAKNAAPAMAGAPTARKDAALAAIARLLSEQKEEIIAANKLDLDRAAENGVPTHMLDRLMLNEKRIDGICDSLLELVKLKDPIGSGTCWTRPSGITINQVRAPLGVIAIIYEARPNVTVDAAALCLKSGNATVLRGGKEAINSNRALVGIMRRALAETGLPEDAVGLVTDTSHESSNLLMTQVGLVDLLIPRGSHRLIRAVVDNAKVPVIETGAGNCHLYIDATADPDMAVKIAVNAKCQRPAVCNAIETLLVHKDVSAKILPLINDAMRQYRVNFRCDDATAGYFDADAVTPAQESDWGEEYDDYILAVKEVGSIDEAIAHINKYNTGHSEAIVTDSETAARKFSAEVDAAAVYVNASTRFTDGGEFGFGAEIGISTQKLHARGPMGLEALTTVKYLVSGNGSIRK